LRLWDMSTNECLYASAAIPNTASLLLLKNNESFVIENTNIAGYPSLGGMAPLLVRWFSDGPIRVVSVMPDSQMNIFVRGNLVNLVLLKGNKATFLDQK
jgi:hypothetical protein